LGDNAPERPVSTEFPRLSPWRRQGPWLPRYVKSSRKIVSLSHKKSAQLGHQSRGRSFIMAPWCVRGCYELLVWVWLYDWLACNPENKHLFDIGWFVVGINLLVSGPRKGCQPLAFESGWITVTPVGVHQNLAIKNPCPPNSQKISQIGD